LTGNMVAVTNAKAIVKHSVDSTPADQIKVGMSDAGRHNLCKCDCILLV